MDIKGVVTAEKILTRNDYITPGRPSVSLASRACGQTERSRIGAETKASLDASGGRRRHRNAGRCPGADCWPSPFISGPAKGPKADVPCM